MFENSDVSRVFLASGEESVKLDLARLVWPFAIPSLTKGDVDCLCHRFLHVDSGFGKETNSEVTHHAVDETLTLEATIVVCLGTDPHVRNVEGEAFVGHLSNFPGATEVLLDGRDVSSIISGRSTCFKHSSTFASFTGLLTVLSFVMFVRFWLAARSLLFLF